MLRPLAELLVFGVAPLLFGLFAVPSAAPAAGRCAASPTVIQPEG